MYNVYVGWDEREQEAYDACVKSIRQNCSSQVLIRPLKINEFIEAGVYKRHLKKETVSTGFAFTRFLVPWLMDYHGWGVFVDCDFIFTKDIKDLFEQGRKEYAVMCVQHDYIPKQQIKMDGCKQTVFARKNWSSMMLFNCGHIDTQRLTSKTVNTQDAAWLHQMKWTDDEKIGSLDLEWNWLVGEYDGLWQSDVPPAAIHYTNGGPWLLDYQNIEFASEYWKYATKTA